MVENALQSAVMVRDARWSEALAVSGMPFVEKIKSELGSKAMHRTLEQAEEGYALRERGEAYNGDFRPQK